jgi:tRNA(adenine34) deaminase
MANDHHGYMCKALELARQALDRQEFPVGCVLVYQNDIIATGRRTGTHQTIPSELDHAEIVALRRLETIATPMERSRMVLYTTLEPCLMCYGALLISGIGTIVYAYEDAMGGGAACNLDSMPPLYKNSGMKIVPGICRSESLDLFKAFFANPVLDYWRGSYLARYTLDQ